MNGGGDPCGIRPAHYASASESGPHFADWSALTASSCDFGGSPLLHEDE